MKLKLNNIIINIFLWTSLCSWFFKHLDELDWVDSWSPWHASAMQKIVATVQWSCRSNPGERMSKVKIEVATNQPTDHASGKATSTSATLWLWTLGSFKFFHSEWFSCEKDWIYLQDLQLPPKKISKDLGIRAIPFVSKAFLSESLWSLSHYHLVAIAVLSFFTCSSCSSGLPWANLAIETSA